MEEVGKKDNLHHTQVSTATITQATAATFFDLFIGLTFLCFIRTGTKRVICPINGEMIGKEGDLFIFPPGSMVTLENRPVLNETYRADAVYFSADMIEEVFSKEPIRTGPSVQIVRSDDHRTLDILSLIHETLDNHGLPAAIRQHRLLEPLIWLRHHGIYLASGDEARPYNKVRRLIETDPSHAWKADEVAQRFAMSEPTFRRWLARSGQGFSKIVQNTRLEKGLAMLQTTDMSVSLIAMECGFSTASHFADAFRKRFGIKPTAIRSMSI